jgi:ribosomal protein L37AE/L43A
MELTIDYECPQCKKSYLQRFADISPGKLRKCARCGATVVLTIEGLRGFERALAAYCRH